MDNLIKWNFCASWALTDSVSFDNHIHMACTQQARVGLLTGENQHTYYMYRKWAKYIDLRLMKQ